MLGRKAIKKYLDRKISSNQYQLKYKCVAYYLKLPYIDNFLQLWNFWNFASYFSYKDPIPDNLKSFLVYKFTCASCSFSYIGETGLVFLNI